MRQIESRSSPVPLPRGNKVSTSHRDTVRKNTEGERERNKRREEEERGRRRIALKTWNQLHEDSVLTLFSLIPELCRIRRFSNPSSRERSRETGKKFGNNSTADFVGFFKSRFRLLCTCRAENPLNSIERTERTPFLLLYVFGLTDYFVGSKILYRSERGNEREREGK